MNASVLKLASGFVSAALVGGCATVAPEAGFGQVEQLVDERVGQRVHWYRGTEADAQVEEAVQAMLRREIGADEAVQIALLRNRRLQAIYEDLGIAQADLVQAGLLRNPVFHGELLFPVDAGGRTQIHLSVTQEFISVLQLPLRRRVAEAAFEQTRLIVSDAVLNLAHQVRVAFYELQAAMQLREMFEAVRMATEASADAAVRLHEAGNITDLELANQQALFEQARLDLAAAEANVIDRRERLNALMGLWGPETAEWTVAQRLPELPQEEQTAEGLESLAIRQRLDLAAARQEVGVFVQALGLRRSAALLPALELEVAAERKRDGDWLLGPGVGFPIPLFDQGQAAVARTGAQLRQSWERHAALAVEIRSDVRRLHNQMLSARELAEHYRRVVLPLRNRITQETQLQYNAMQIGIFQLLFARQQEIEAGRAYIETLRDYWTGRSELEHAVGGRLPSPEPVEPTLLPFERELEGVEDPHGHHH